METTPLLGWFVKFIPAQFIGKFTVPLKVGKKSQQKILDKKWKIIVNTEIEIDE